MAPLQKRKKLVVFARKQNVLKCIASALPQENYALHNASVVIAVIMKTVKNK